MAEKYVADVLHTAKETASYADFLEELANTLDQDEKPHASFKKAMKVSMPTDTIRGAVFTLREYSALMTDVVNSVKVEWPPKYIQPQ